MAKEIQNMGMPHNVLAFGTKVQGNIVADSDFRLDGAVEGDLNCSGKVVVGPQGALKGNLICHNAEIMGRIDGKIVVSEVLSLKESSRVFGEIKTKILTIEPKAVFTGTCDMGTGTTAAAPKK